MFFQDKQFFDTNTARINRLILKILLFLNALPPLFYFLTKIGVFHIDTPFVIFSLIVVLVFSFTDLIGILYFDRPKIKKYHPVLYSNMQRIFKYYGLCGAIIVLGVLGSHARIGIYISYAIVVYMSCFYYDRKTTSITSIIAYFVMLVSLYFKSKSRFEMGLIDEGVTVIRDFISYASGFTLEFLFVFAVSFSVSKLASNTLYEVLEKKSELNNMQLEIMGFIPKILESHELFTGHHVKHTVKYVELISRELARQGKYKNILTENMISLYSAAANLHDIGKIHIPDNILNKPGKFTDVEYEMMKLHPLEGKKLIESLPRISEGKFNEIAMQMAYCHHERYDGMGYPNKIAGDEIPLCARIMTAADVLDALLSWRPYKEPFEIDKVMKIMEESRGTMFEPCIVDAVISLKPIIFMLSHDFQQAEIAEEEAEFAWRHKLEESRKKSVEN